ncbi:MAG: JAB domain-containing protein [Cytophagales bacterium]|nr:JAB domain-containing protein [Cytophagales bacterium]
MTIELPEDHSVKILNADDLFEIMVSILLREDKIDRDKEHFWVVGLANNQKLLFIELISLGTVNKTLVEPMEVFSVALQKRAVRIILVHNHPSGELKPSDADKDLTDRLIQVGKIVNTPVYDHLIITRKSFLSFKDVDLMDKLELSRKYVPPYVQMEKVKKELTEQAEERNTIKIAKEMKREGQPVEQIARITGLSLEDVKALRVRRKSAS